MKGTRGFTAAVLMFLALVGYATPAVAQPVPISRCMTITSSGSYVLTQNLSSRGHCLVIGASDVTLDLGGFVISWKCDDSPCLNLGSGIADRETSDAPQENVSIRNGTIRGFGIAGINLLNTKYLTIEGVRLIRNGIGLRAGYKVIVKDSIVARNERGGILLERLSIVTGNLVTDNGSDGISTGGAVITGNTVGYNRSRGIQAHNGSVVLGNVATDTDGEAIAASRSLVVNNAAIENREGLHIYCPTNVVGNLATSNQRRDLAMDPRINYGGDCERTANLPAP
jgi:hypothetical protein